MSRSTIDDRVKNGLRSIAAVSLIIVGLIFIFLVVESLPAVRKLGWRMISDRSWNPAESAEVGNFGLLPIILGSLLVSVGAVVIATPLGVASAVFSRFYAPEYVGFVYRRLVELLAGIPSVVFGFWGLVVLCPVIGRFAEFAGAGQLPGPSLLSAVLIVALMVLPTVMLMSEAALASVRREYILSGAALGLSRFSIVRQIAIPQARTGIVTGIVLAAARAVGETMAVVMVAGNVVEIPDSIFAPVRTLTANIALEMGYAVGIHRSTLFFSGLLLMTAVAILFAIEIYLRRVVWRNRT